MGITVSDTVTVTERRSILLAGLEEAVFGGGALRKPTVTDELVLAGSTAGEAIDA